MRDPDQHSEDVLFARLQHWPLFLHRHCIDSHQELRPRWLYLGYHTRIPRSINNDGTTHFTINVIYGIFYLLYVEIEPTERGKGYGDQLYTLLEQVASDLGCREFRQTPSGTTRGGETRRDYLLRRHWLPITGSVEVFKPIVASDEGRS